jgi:hypothetical protein
VSGQWETALVACVSGNNRSVIIFCPVLVHVLSIHTFNRHFGANKPINGAMKNLTPRLLLGMSMLTTTVNAQLPTMPTDLYNDALKASYGLWENTGWVLSTADCHSPMCSS